MAKGKLSLMMKDPIEEINNGSDNDKTNELKKVDQVGEGNSEVKEIQQENNGVATSEAIKKNNAKKKVLPVQENSNFKVVKVYENTYYDIKKALVMHEMLKGVKIQEFVNEAISEKLERLKKKER